MSPTASKALSIASASAPAISTLAWSALGPQTYISSAPTVSLVAASSLSLDASLGAYRQGAYNMGGYGAGSVYLVTPHGKNREFLRSLESAVGTSSAPAPPPGATPIYRSPPRMACVHRVHHREWIRLNYMPNSPKGVALCEAQCALHNYKYFGFECPQKAKVACQCANSLSQSRRLSVRKCQQGRGVHCVGPYKQNGVNMGSNHANSVYLVTPSAKKNEFLRSLEYPLNPNQPKGSPLSTSSSQCVKWYKEHGPVKHGGKLKATNYFKKSGLTKRTLDKGNPIDGTGWAVRFKHGCSRVVNGAGTRFKICGCDETWCPMRSNVIGRPDDRDIGRTTCFSSKAIFGCFEGESYLVDCGWNDAWQGPYEKGKGTAKGLFVMAWEQLVF